MAESVADFLARGGEIQEVVEEDRTYRDGNAFNRAHRKQQNQDNYEDFCRRQGQLKNHKEKGND